MAEIVCPECHTRFRTGRDLAGESVSCARCGAVFVVEPAGAVREEPEETPRPVSRMPRPRVMEKKKKETTKKPAGKKKGRRARKGPLLPMPLVIALGLGLFAVVLWMFVPGLSDAIRKGPGAVLSRIGVGDSAASLNREVTAVFVEAREVLASVKDAASGQAAVGRIKELNGRLVDIQRRAMSAPSVTPAELQEIANPSSRMAEAEAARKEMERIAAGNLATRELGDELSKFTRLLSAAGSAASTGLMLADARNEYDEIEREHVEIIKRVSLAILSANDAAALDWAASVCEAGTRELKALVERRERAGGSKRDIASALDRYRQARNGANAGTFDHTFSLAERGIQSAALQRAESSFREAERELSDEMRFGMLAGSMGSSAPVSSNAPAGSGEVTIKFDGGIFNKPDPFRNQSPPPTQAEFSAAINELRAAKEKGLETMKFALDRLVALTGASATTSFLDGSSGNARFPYAGNLQTLAKKIDFARVDSVDEASRTIQITMDRELSAMPAAAGNVSVQIAAGVYDGTAIAPPAFGVSDDRRSDAFFKWGDALRDVTGLLEALAGSKHNSFKESNYKADIRVPYAGNVQELATRIDFARVDSVDEGTRTIRITLDRELAAKPR